MRQWLAKKRETLFNVLFVMMEGLELEFREIAWRKTCFLFLVDFLQLLRILTLPVFGWSEKTSGLIEKFDIVYDVTLLGSMVVPRYSFFILAFIAVTFALVETGFVAKIFEAGSVKQMWPVKMLRILVVMMVTTFFSSLVKWLLIPFSCLFTEEASFSAAVHGDGTTCNPLRFPEVLAAAPTILVATLYIAFAFVATTFSMQVNLLSRAPRSSSTGRVEILFLANKVAATCLVLLCNLISPTAVTIILLLISLCVFWLHANTLPFHHHPTNVLRGGIYGASSWACLSSTIVSIIDSLTLQWVLIALLPVAFLAGMWYVNNARARLLAALDRLRGEWEQRVQFSDLMRVTSRESALSPPLPVQRRLSINGAFPRRASAAADSLGSPKVPMAVYPDEIPSMGGERRAKTQSAAERFYDTIGERRRIFVSGRHALACARTLLYQRAADDREFLEYVIERGLEDFRDYQPLMVFRILVMSIVHEKHRSAKAEQKRVKDSGESLPIDLRYLLYCFERKTTQDQAAQNLGKQHGGQISAINLMEFNLGLTKAKEAHQKALLAIRNCWRLMHKLVKSGGHGKMLTSSATRSSAASAESAIAPKRQERRADSGSYEEVVALLEDFSQAAREAQNEYSSLLFKYPTSVELLFSYAAFLDVCVNDSAESDAKLAQAINLQDGDSDYGGENMSRHSKEQERVMVEVKTGEGMDGKSATSGSSSSQDKRKTTMRFVMGWQHRIMGHESKLLATLVWRIKVATVFLVVTATVAFIVSDFVLFKGMTKSEMHRITSIGDLYTYVVMIIQSVRTLQLGVQRVEGAHMPSVPSVREYGRRIVSDMQAMHFVLHDNVDFHEANEFFNVELFTTLVPTAGGWKEDHSTLWEVGNEFTTRAQLAYACTEEEMRNQTYSMRDISEHKRNIPYLWENGFHVIVPELELLKGIYVHEMKVIQRTVDLLVIINVSCNSFLVLLITVLVMRGLWTVMHHMEGKALVVRLMCSLNRRTTRRIHEYYRKAEQNLQQLEDEDVERRNLLAENDPEPAGSYGPPGSPKLFPSADGRTSAGASDPRLWEHSREGLAPRYDELYGRGEQRPATRTLQGRVPLGNSGGSPRDHPDDSSDSQNNRTALKPGMPVPVLFPKRGPFTPQAKLSSPFLALSPLRADDGPPAAVGTDPADAPPVVLPLTAENLESVYREERPTRRKDDSEGSSAVQETAAVAALLGLQDGVAAGSLKQADSVFVGRPEACPSAGKEEEEAGVEEGGEVPRVDVLGMDVGEIEMLSEGGSVEEAAGGLPGAAAAAAAARELERGGADEDRRPEAGAGVTGEEARGEGEGAEGKDEWRRVEDPGESEGGESEGSEHKRGGLASPSILRSVQHRESGRRPPGPLRPLVSFRVKSGGSGSLGALAQALGGGKSSPQGSLRRSGSGSGRASPEGSLKRLGKAGSLKKAGSFRKSGSFKKGGSFRNVFHSHHEGEEERAAAAAAELERAIRKRRPWILWTSTWLAMFAVLMTLCVVSTVLATRDFEHLIALAPIVKEAGRRLMLVKAAATFARELVLDDRFSRMNRQELSDGVAYILVELKHSDRALRLGHDPELGIVLGADERNAEHNQVMYGSACPWLDAEWQAAHAAVTGVPVGGHKRAGGPPASEEEGSCVDPAMPSISNSGLLSVLVAFESALESVLHRYGLPADQSRGAKLFQYNEKALDALGGSEHLATHYEVKVRAERVLQLEKDEDMAFVMACSDGYLAQGLTYIMELFDHELDLILEEAIELNEILFALYLVTVAVAFWYFLFRRSRAHAEQEARSAQALVLRMPLHILLQEEIDGIAEFFRDGDEDHDEEGEDLANRAPSTA